jgi:protein involved in polysaccharide export with SLBB domain
MPDESLVDLLEAVGMAGGYTKLANPAKITVKRITDGRESIIKIDGKRMLKDPSIADFEVMPGDTIVVGEAIF